MAATTIPQAPPHVQIRPRSALAALDAREAWRFRELLWMLALRDLKLRYKQTALGVAWVVLQPLLAAGIFAFVFGRVADLPSEGVPYFLFAYAGLLAWSFFQTALTQVSVSMTANAPLVSKVYFPRLILPLSTLPTALLNFAVALALLAIMLALEQRLPGPEVLLLPLWLALPAMLALGLGLGAATLAVQYRDVQHVLPVATQMLLYASPVAYAVSAVPEGLRAVYRLNPLAAPLEAMRWSLLGTAPPEWGWIGYSAAVSVLVLVLGALFFAARERRFADVI